jgi:processing peptidase subunit beta
MCIIAGGWDKQSTVGQHAGSLLTQRIAVDELADSFTAFNTNYHDTGLFGVYAVTDRDRCSDLTWVIMNELTKLCYEVREDDVARAKNALKASLLFAQDSTHREWRARPACSKQCTATARLVQNDTLCVDMQHLCG